MESIIDTLYLDMNNFRILLIKQVNKLNYVYKNSFSILNFTLFI